MASEFNKHMLKPSQFITIAVLCLIDGILNAAWGLANFMSIFLGYLPSIPISAYCLSLSILEIRYAISLFSDPIKTTKPILYIPIMQILNVLTLNVFTLFLGSPIIGVVILALYKTDAVRNYFQWRQSLSPIQLEKSSPEKMTSQGGQEMFVQSSLVRGGADIAPPTLAKKRVSGSAIVSFIFGLLAAVFPIPIVHLIFVTIGAVTGINALRKIKKGNGAVKGQMLAQLGLGLSIASFVVYILICIVAVYFFPRALFAQAASPILTAMEIVKILLEIVHTILPRLLPPPAPTPTSWILQILALVRL